MRALKKALYLLLFLPLFTFAEVITFEEGIDRQKINTSIEGVQFTTTNGQDWIFLDMREGYNTSYHVDGNFAAWLGENQGSGRIDFDQGVATRVSVDYSAYSGLHLEAYDASGVLLHEDHKGGNVGSGQLKTLTVEAPNIAYVLVHDSGNRWLIDNLEVELGDVQLLELDLLEYSNEVKHHTDKYEDNVVFRRAQELTFNVVTTPGYDSKYYQLELVATDSDGNESIMTDGSSIHVDKWKSEFSEPENEDSQPGYQYNNYAVIPVTVYIPYDLAIGKYNFSVKLKRKNGIGEAKNLSAEDDTYILFNPWGEKDDDVYGSMSDSEKSSYTLKEKGTLYKASNPKAWNFNQFNKTIFEQSMEFVKELPKADRAKAWRLARHFSSHSNSKDNSGVLVGKWTGSYSGGKHPGYWSNSKQIFDQYGNNSSVKYGQCWVFSGVLNSMLRSVGIPARSITNINSAHDANADGIIKYLKGDLDGSHSNDPLYKDSIWNYHVWNEVWLKRADRSTYQQISWQAVDGTPQERSDGLFQAGPAPVTAIKANASGQYDVNFIRSEVQAPYEIWEENWFGQGVTLVKRGEHRSKGMLTTDHSGNKTNVISNYCSDCQTFKRNIQHAYKAANVDGVGAYQIIINSKETVSLGSIYSGTIVITNTGGEKDTFASRILMLAKSSNGQILEKWGELIKSDFELGAGESKTIAFSFIVPMSKKVMPSADGFAIEAAVIGNQYTGYGELIGDLVALDSNLTASTVADDGSATVTATVTNHTSVGHNTEVILTLPTGITSVDNLVKMKAVPANGSATLAWSVQVPDPGKYHLEIEVKTPDLLPVYASTDIDVLESEDFSIIVNVPKLVQLGQTENAEIVITNKGSRTLDLSVSVSVGSGLQADKQVIQVAGLLSGKTYSETVAIQGNKVGKYAISTFGEITTQEGTTLHRRAVSMIGVQVDNVQSTVKIQPEQIQYSGSGEESIDLKISTDSDTDEEVSISSSSSDKSIRYSIYDGNERILNQSVVVASGVDKVLTLKLEGSDKSGTISVTVTPVDNPYGSDESSLIILIGTPPVANAGNDQTVTEGTSVTLTGIASTDLDGDQTILQYDWTQLSGAGVALTPVNGSPADVSFILNSVGSAGEELHFRLTVTDDTGLTSTDEVVVFVNNENEPPVAVDDVAVTVKNTAVTISNVLSNDTDADGDTLIISAADTASTKGGIVVNHNDSTFTYTPKVGFVGIDTFTYIVSDGNGGIDEGTVTITINEPAIVAGDANADGKINVQDLIKIINHILGVETANGNPDCNADGSVNSLDTVCIINKILGT